MHSASWTYSGMEKVRSSSMVLKASKPAFNVVILWAMVIIGGDVGDISTIMGSG